MSDCPIALIQWIIILITTLLLGLLLALENEV
jgi:hypothetical protein